jgi:hypothetical protein
MNMQSRPVDSAMADNRPEKRIIRNLWLEEVLAVAKRNPSSEEPFYLTLPGAEGRDIQLLIENGLISLTEVGSIAEKDQGKVVAVESNNQAVLKLQKKFAGLCIRQVNFRSLIRSEGQFKWPEGKDEKYCRARVVNLDLNSPLKAEMRNGDVVFPVLAWIDKLCQIHAKEPRIDWTLCLTLHGEVVWPEEVNHYTQKFLCENIGREPKFDEGCKEIFNEKLYQVATGEDVPNFTELDREDQQKLIMVMVPKIIARLVHDKGWRVKTERNLMYGGVNRAPMVTWIVKFTWGKEAIAEPDATYREALREIFSGIGVVTDTGKIS